jgi:hypothetical protein
MTQDNAGELLLEKETICKQIHSLTLQLAAAADANDLTKVTDLLDQRERYMTMINRLDERLSAFGQASVTPVNLQTEQTKQILLQIKAEDSKIRRQLSNRMRMLRDKIIEVKQIKRLSLGYKNGGVNLNGALFDERQ